MRWWSVLCAVLVASTLVTADKVTELNHASVTTGQRPPLQVGARSSILGPEPVALAIQEVVKAVVATIAGLDMSFPVQSCRIPDKKKCWLQSLRAIKADPPTLVWIGSIGVNEMAMEDNDGIPFSAYLEDRSIRDFGDIVPASRRACLATDSPAKSLLDLANPSIAASYYIPYEKIQHFMKECDGSNCHSDWTPDWCKNETCATILTSRKGEADVLLEVIKANKLSAYIIPFEDNLLNVTSALSSAQPIIACDWAPELYLTGFTNRAKALGPPPCIDPWCPFETRRTVIFGNTVVLGHLSPSAYNALRIYKIPKANMLKLAENAIKKGPKEAASIYIREYPPKRDYQVKAIVLMPMSNDRGAFNIPALQTASVLAEEDIKGLINFKPRIYDDECRSLQASESFIGAQLRSDFSQQSLVAGSACGANWNDGAKQIATFRIPMLAYNLQAPAALVTKDHPLQMLAAGDARDAASALAEFVQTLGWRRVAALYEPATKPLLSAMDRELTFSIEVLENGTNIGYKFINDWASKAAEKNVRILYLCVEDTRIARAALCEARAHGLTPESGTVLLLCNTHKNSWLKAGPGENCTTEQLQKEAEGHFSVTPDWVLSWNDSLAKNGSKEWQDRWVKACISASMSEEARSFKFNCSEITDPYAELLYDMLVHWANSLSRLLKNNAYAANDLHSAENVRFLINDTVKCNYTGRTGVIQWKESHDAYSRKTSFVILQWDSKRGVTKIGTWGNNTLTMDREKLQWQTPDGKMPDDGAEKCALEGLANALNTDCKLAFVALCSILVAILGAAVVTVAWHCKRRAEKEYRKRLQLLGMRPLAIKPIGLDRWEVPRERVVINRKLGTGAFGTVYGGHALLSEDRGWSAVAVKTLKAGATTEEKLDFLSEAEAMKRFDHKNVVRLLGVVTKTEPVCTVMEFMLYGDLKNYLLARRHLAMGGGMEESEGLEADEVSPRRLTGMALDVARALSYLAQLRYVHRDVAARNCLISARRVVKIADFGMTRLVFENDYYRFSRKGMLPVRWMAPESLALGVFSPASDVWSFGVLLYEIVTFGSLPFQGLSNSEVLAKVKGGHTLDLPQGLKPQLDGLIKSCWQQDPKKRPTASEVAAFLADAPRLLSPCVDVPIDALTLDSDPPWRLPRDQAEARWVSWAAPASATTDTTYLSTEGAVPLDTDSFLP